MTLDELPRRTRYLASLADDRGTCAMIGHQIDIRLMHGQTDEITDAKLDQRAKFSERLTEFYVWLKMGCDL